MNFLGVVIDLALLDFRCLDTVIVLIKLLVLIHFLLDFLPDFVVHVSVLLLHSRLMVEHHDRFHDRVFLLVDIVDVVIRMPWQNAHNNMPKTKLLHVSHGDLTCFCSDEQLSEGPLDSLFVSLFKTCL